MLVYSDGQSHALPGLRRRHGGTSCDADEDSVPERRIDVEVHAQLGDPAVAGVPRAKRLFMAEEGAQRVDGWLPEVQPISARTDGEGKFKSDGSILQRRDTGEGRANLLLRRRVRPMRRLS